MRKRYTNQFKAQVVQLAPFTIRQDLIAAKHASGLPQALLDVALLNNPGKPIMLSPRMRPVTVRWRVA